jgi:hypothetical protein
MADVEFTPNMSRAILRDDDDFSRFEKFCCELFTYIDGVRYVPTSRSHDLGRDGKSDALDPERLRYFLCASTKEKDPRGKALKDLREVLRHTTPIHVRFCFTQEVREDVAEDIVRQAEAMASDVRFTVTGLTQFVTYAGQNKRVFLQFYAHEIRDLRDCLMSDPNKGAEQAPSLRLALATALSGDLKSVREQVARNLVLHALSEKAELTLEEVAALVSLQLGLVRPVATSCLLLPVEKLIDEGAIERRDRHLRVSPIGVAEHDSSDAASTSSLLNGRKAIRDALTALVGKNLSNKDFSKIWDLIRNELAHMFLHYGMNIVREVAKIAGDATVDPRQTGLDQHIRQLAGRIARVDLESVPDRSKAETAEELSRAIYHVFGSRNSVCFDWLGDLCVVYLAMCSLGLEPSIQDRVCERVKSWDVLLDTHIILSCVAGADEHHEYVTQSLRGWTTLGGHLFGPSPVLEEALHHVSMAKRDFQGWHDSFLAGKKFDEQCDPISRLGENPNIILKSFVQQNLSDPNPRRFAAFISNFIGRRGDDLPLRRWLKSKFNVQELADADLDEAEIEKIRSQMKPSWGVRGYYYADLFDASASSRCDCDARLVCLLLKLRDQQLAQGRNAVLVSKSTSLQTAVESILAKSNDVRPAVVSLHALTFALALIPRSQMSIASLRETLFGDAFVRRLPSIKNLRQTAFRAVSDDETDLMDEPRLTDSVDDALSRPGYDFRRGTQR